MARVFPKFSCLDAWPLPMLCRRSVRHWCGKAGVDDRRRDLIPVLRLAFGLYLQRRELHNGAGGDEAAPLASLTGSRSGAVERPSFPMWGRAKTGPLVRAEGLGR